MKGQAPPQPREMAPEERKRILVEAVAAAVAQPGEWQVVSESDFDAVVAGGRRTNHVLHLILSIVTLGWWLPVWLIVTIVNKERRLSLTVDTSGTVTTRTHSRVVRATPPTVAARAMLPTTRLGRWAVRLAGAAVVIALAAAPIYLWIPGGEWVNAVLGGPALAAAVGAGVLAPIAIIRDGDRALSVFAATIPLLFLLVLTALELSGVGPAH